MEIQVMKSIHQLQCLKIRLKFADLILGYRKLSCIMISSNAFLQPHLSLN